MSNLALCISIVTLAIIKSSLCIQIVERPSSARQFCLEKMDDKLICARCIDKIEKQQFYTNFSTTNHKPISKRLGLIANIHIINM